MDSTGGKGRAHGKDCIAFFMAIAADTVHRADEGHLYTLNPMLTILRTYEGLPLRDRRLLAKACVAVNWGHGQGEVLMDSAESAGGLTPE